jgi:hypothetical protein
MEIVLCLGHSDVEQATFLLDLGRGSGTTIGRHATIDDVEQIDRLPLLSLGGVDRGKDEVILVEQRHAGRSLVASGGSKVSSVRKRSREGYTVDARTAHWAGEVAKEYGCKVEPLRLN